MGDVIELSDREAKEIIGKECQRRLGMSLEEFQQNRMCGNLPKSVAVSDIESLLKFAGLL